MFFKCCGFFLDLQFNQTEMHHFVSDKNLERFRDIDLLLDEHFLHSALHPLLLPICLAVVVVNLF